MSRTRKTAHAKPIPWEIVRCPSCLLGGVNRLDNAYVCNNPVCNKSYPEIDGVPVFIKEESSVFSICEFTRRKATFFKERGRFVEWLNKTIPSISHNYAARENYDALSKLAVKNMPNARVLVIGGSVAGQGFESLIDNPALELIETDVSFGPRVAMICDAHDLPFMEGCFDVVIVQAVLEHVVDPFRCVSELCRVLRDDGLIYAETPFMQQVHGGIYDFMRFTYRGHRRLFRNFDQIRAGMTGGPGMALAWSWQYFLRSFGTSTRAKMYLAMIGRLTAFYFKYFDYLLNRNPGAYDSASGYYFLGRKSKTVLSDKDLVHLYTVPL